MLAELEKLAGRIGVEVRFESFDPKSRGKGGLCRVHGAPLVVVDERLTVLEKIGILSEALACFDLQPMFVPAVLRARIERGARATGRRGPVRPPLRPPAKTRPRARSRGGGRSTRRRSRGHRTGTMSLPLFTVDAFTDRPFGGNPAAVCILDRARDEAWMRQVAAEMNLSETAFLAPRADGDLDLRWFTPEVEVDLCGHATLASAHVLWETGRLDRAKSARFHTKSGVLGASREGDRIALDFPSRHVAEAPVPEGLLAALGLARVAWSGREKRNALLLLDDEREVRALKPDFAALRRVDVRAALVTAPASTSAADGVDFVSRFFGPSVGIDEDPVTGAAHGLLATFWGARLGKTAMTGFQASKRGGTVGVRVEGERTKLLGKAVIVARGELLA
jgi:PhzF family phenazine biosynthesis protein